MREFSIREVLSANEQLLVPELLLMLEQVEGQLRERGDQGPADRAKAALAVARTMIEPPEAPEVPERPSSSGLQMAKR